MLKRYTQKSITVEAIQYDGNNGHLIETLFGRDNVIQSPILEPTPYNPTGQYLQIRNAIRIMTAVVGDWIIRGVKGDIYPCKPNLFGVAYVPMTNAIEELLLLEEDEKAVFTALAQLEREAVHTESGLLDQTQAELGAARIELTAARKENVQLREQFRRIADVLFALSNGQKLTKAYEAK